MTEPHTFLVATNGVNHALLFRDRRTAEAAQEALAQAFNAVVTGETPNRVFQLTDSFGTVLTVSLAEVRSFRLTNLNQENEGAGLLKIAEATAALAFQEKVKAEHPALAAAVRGGSGSKLWTPGG